MLLSKPRGSSQKAIPPTPLNKGGAEGRGIVKHAG